MRTILAVCLLALSSVWPSEARAASLEPLMLQLDAVPPYLNEITDGPPLAFGPGSQLVTTFGGTGGAGCTANFVWMDQHGKLYLGTAGHCVLSGANSMFETDTSRFQANVVINGGRVRLGPIAYARQSNGHGYDIGNDFALIEIPEHLLTSVRTRMPVWDGPYGTGIAEYGEQTVHYGYGMVFGNTNYTRARAGISLGGWKVFDDVCDTGICETNRRTDAFSASGPGIFGDSGSAVNLFNAGRPLALGVLTHGLPGYYSGTTIARAKEMALEAGLQIELVLAG